MADMIERNRPLALHHLTVREASLRELVELAAETGCEDVCVFTHAPRIPIPGAKFTSYPLVTPENLDETVATLRANAIGVANIEFFPVTVDFELADYRPFLEIGARLGARRMVTHIHDEDDARAVDTLGRLCDFAGQFDLDLGLEFMGLTPACAAIGRADWFVTQVARPNLGIAMDALHLIRTGGTAEDIARIPAERFCYAQICDGHTLEAKSDYRPEGQDREVPGDGDWPLHAIFSALPAATPLDVEVPSTTRVSQGVSARDRARVAVCRSRALVEGLEPER